MRDARHEQLAFRFDHEVDDGRHRHLPVLRSECVDGPRPCPYLTCRHHLLVDVTDGGGVRTSVERDEAERGDGWRAIRFTRRAIRNRARFEASALETGVLDALFDGRPTCALDEAERGGMDQVEVGAALGISHQAVSVVEQTALAKVRGAIEAEGVGEALLETWLDGGRVDGGINAESRRGE